MKVAATDYIINTVARTNILPVISKCNTSCIFCSHLQNPDDIEVFRLPDLKYEDFEELIEYLSPERKIVVGESATRIIEGEPLLHKDFAKIISRIRSRFKDTVIQVTTNGILLGEELVTFLRGLGKIELNISVNCINPIKRMQLLKNADNIMEKLCLLKGKLRFSGSAVVVPEVLKDEDIEELVKVLNDCGAHSVRLFLPGYTKKSRLRVEKLPYPELEKLIERLSDKYQIPVIIEPSHIKDLDCRIEGVVEGTPSDKAGLKKGDIIIAVNGTDVRSRVEAFEACYKYRSPNITIDREGNKYDIKLDKEKNSAPGFVVLYDVSPKVSDDILSLLIRTQSRNTLFITSELAYDIMTKLLSRTIHNADYRIVAAKNSHFGGNIMCAGLLTLEDVISTVSEFIENGQKPDLIVLPPIMFDYKGNDLLGKNKRYIEAVFNIPVETV